MNSIPSSKLGGLALCLVLALAVTGTAVAFDASAEGLQDEYQVGSDADVTYTIADPFTDVPNQYTLRGETELTNVSWTVTVYRAGSQVSQNTYGTQNFSQDLDVNNNGDEVEVRLQGSAPEIANYTYDPAESFQVAELTRVSGNNPETFRTDTAHHYTAESDEARAAIEDAQQAIEDAGGNDEAERLVGNAISSYEAEDFENAIDLAGQAQERAESAQAASQRNQLILLAVGGLIVVGLVVGGVLYWRSQQDEYTKL
jgi:hypothetical protein